MLSTTMPSQPFRPAKSISLSKCSKFRTDTLFFNFIMWHEMMMMLAWAGGWCEKIDQVRLNDGHQEVE